MGSDEDPQEYDAARKIFRIGLAITGVLGIFMIILMGIWVFIFADGTKVPVNVHIIVMLIFFIFLQGHVNLIYRIFPDSPKLKVKLTHFGIHLLIVIGVSVGLYFAVHHHNKKNDPHFYTFHSWIGLIAIILYYGQFLAGMGTFLLPVTSLRVRQLVLPFHKFLGPMIFLLAVAAAGSGIMMKALGQIGGDYHNYPASGLIINLVGLLLVFFSLGIVFLLYEHRFRRRPRPEGDMLLTDSKDDSEQ